MRHPAIIDPVCKPLPNAALFLKRVTDITVSLIVSLILSPAMLLIAIAIRLDSPGPSLFKQRRVGLMGNYFDIYKFRSMFHGTPDLPTDQMMQLPSPVTKVGKLLRATSLDELPQLFNVLKGDMSLVGPRPALYNQTGLTARRKQCGVLRFRPGVTGWAQINGRDELDDDTKLEFDQWYCDHWHYLLDWKILLSTFQAVGTGRGAF